MIPSLPHYCTDIYPGKGRLYLQPECACFSLKFLGRDGTTDTYFLGLNAVIFPSFYSFASEILIIIIHNRIGQTKQSILCNYLYFVLLSSFENRGLI